MVEIKNVFVMGAGTMGSGIAQAVAQAGYRVTMMDVAEDILTRGMGSIDKSLGKAVSKGAISNDDKQQILSRIATATRIDGAKNADLVIEAVPEILAMKMDTFRRLDNICPEHTILASNTSALPISIMAAVTKEPSRVIGIHFMNPVPLMKGVEIIRGRHTSEDTLQAAKTFVVSLGKEPCEAVDYAGFIVSRIIDAMMNEAFYCVMDGNRPEEVDKAMRLCCNFPIGPLELCDLVGADIVYHGLTTLQKEFGERLRPAPLLMSMVRAGELGRKAGKGFYDYRKQA